METSQKPSILGDSPRPGEGSKAPSRRLLLVDDQHFFLTLGQNILRGAGYEVETTSSGSEAMKVARATRPDAILLDVEMPGMDGFETCRRLKADPITRAIPVAMLTGSLDPEVTKKAYKAGAGATIPKSASAARLLNLLRVFLRITRDRRIAPRALVALPVGYEHSGRVISAETLDINEGGMFIKTPSPAAVGDLLILRFALPGGPPWECSARVLWTRRPQDDHPYPQGMGVQFLDLQAEARAAIAALVAAITPTPAQSRSA